MPGSHKSTVLPLVALITASASTMACNPQNKGHEGGASSASVSAARPPATHAEILARADRSQKLFVAWCSACHGDRGRGDGPAALVLNPKPRNFLIEKFKLRTTVTGKGPRREDIFGTITRGLPGSAMPAFSFLSEEERWLLVDHVRALASLDRKAEPDAIAAAGAEPASDDVSVERGKVIYGKLACAACHGTEGRGDGPSSKELKDPFGRPILARDYTRGEYLGGNGASDIRMRFLSGMDGTPMPSFADSFPQPQDSWDLAHYILSLRVARPAPPADPVLRGRQVVEERKCTGCHVLEGKGGLVGPSLDVIASKMRYDWVKTWLTDPTARGKIYPYTPYRMPNLRLSSEEIESVVALFASLSKRPYPEPTFTSPTFDKDTLAKGQLIYFLKCTECHNMGTVIPTPLAKQQGPDLINVSTRLRYEFIQPWVKNPKEFFPDTRMVVSNLTPAQVEQVSAFVWATSVAASSQGRGPQP